MKPVAVIKIGGALLEQHERMQSFWHDIAALQETHDVVIVHGGGPQATAMARRLGHEPRIVQGRRVTSDLDLDIIRWTLCGLGNASLVAQAQQAGLTAVGLSGADAQTVHVTKRPPWDMDGEQVDFGWVGDVVKVDPTLLRHLLVGGFLPIVATLGIDEAGQHYNVNGDTVTGAIAEAMDADRLLLVTEIGQVQHEGTRCIRLDHGKIEAGIAAGWLKGGMRVKVTVGLHARQAGVQHVHILGPSDLLHMNQGTEIR